MCEDSDVFAEPLDGASNYGRAMPTYVYAVTNFENAADTIAPLRAEILCIQGTAEQPVQM